MLIEISCSNQIYTYRQLKLLTTLVLLIIAIIVDCCYRCIPDILLSLRLSFICILEMVLRTNVTILYVYDTKWYVYIQNSMYRRVVQTSWPYVRILWTTRKFSEQVVYGTNTYSQVVWTTRPFLKSSGTYGTEEVYIYVTSNYVSAKSYVSRRWITELHVDLRNK